MLWWCVLPLPWAWRSARGAFLHRSVRRCGGRRAAMSSIKSAMLMMRAIPGRASRALYGGKQKLFGNNVSHSNRKTRRCWNPNVQNKRFYSDILGHNLRLRVTTHVMRCIDKYGGFDNYILKMKEKHLASPLALNIKQRLLAKLEENQANVPPASSGPT
ncbi:Large ribosomal subunit protein bL28c [Plasmodiophora brassicae]|uniref:Large ribosomal subunit protein bL28c n=1 Tax=Plasmodiophora brassicae TaxID=37360 RepID=A0A0G4J8Q3_PLABS|nr:hypothetical protein PBRA_003519 [Plasmodiophora brassicae]SPQ99873.1 unnamed protein product [Plasmodiophora brassicae]